MNNRVAFAIFFITFHFLTFTPSHFHTFTPSHFHIYLRLMQKALLFVCCMMALPLFGQLFPQLGGQRAGISALTFLKVDVSARSAALGGANVCLSGDAYSTFTNPASLAETEGTSVGLGNTFWVNGINYGYLSANTPTSAGHFGLSIGAFGSGAIPVRTEFQPGGTGQNFYAGYFSAGLTYSKKLTDLFRFGLTARYVREQLDNFDAQTVVLDFGFLYRTDFKDLSFSVLMQSFGLNSVLRGEFNFQEAFSEKFRNLETYPAPTIFKLGVSMVPWKSGDGKQSLTTYLQLNHPNDNAENIRMGVEYNLSSILFLRAGYKINVRDQNFPTAGLGVRSRIGRHPLTIDYALDPTDFLGVIHRFGLQFMISSQER
jgi:hypothetical protein